MERINPHYRPEKLGLTMLSFEDPNADYDFDIICFWKTEDGRIYTATDSVCSCPTPFEDYEGTTLDEVLQKLERVGSVEQAISSFKSWNKNYLPISEQNYMSDWVKANLKL